MATTFDRTSRQVVYTSRAGCPAISSLANPQAGPNATTALQAILNLGQTSALTVVVDQPLLVSEALVYTGTTVRGLYGGSYRPSAASIPLTGLWRLANANTAVLTNAHWASNYDAASPSSSPLTPANITDQDITIRDLFIDGQKRNGAIGQSFQFFGVRNIKVENVFIYDPPLFHTLFANIDHGQFRDLQFCDPGFFSGTFTTSPHTDGLHLVGPVQDISIDGVYGTTGDDFVALNMADNEVSSGKSTSGFPVLYYGHGLRISIRNLFPYNSADVLRMMIGYDVPNNCTSNKCRIDGLVVANVSGSVIQGGMQCSQYPGAGAGSTIAGVELENWNLTIAPLGGANTPCGMQIGQVFGDITIRDVKFRDVQGASIAHQINVTSGAVGGRLVVDGLSIREDSSEAASPDPAIAVTGGTVDELIVRNSGWARNAATNDDLCSVTGGTVNRLAMEHISCNNIANLLSFTGGTIGQVDSGPICHRNPDTSGPAGGAAINVGTGVTLPLLTAVGSDTAALIGTSAGTITTKKTDGTERGA